jgi:hypothetical protein
MAKGTIGKQQVADKIKAAFGQDWIGEYDKKYYVWTTENGERIQIAISMTCPKVQVEVAATTPGGDFNFEDDAPAAPVVATGFAPAEITDEERNNIIEMMKALGL